MLPAKDEVDEERAVIDPRRLPGDPEIDHPIILTLFEPFYELIRKSLKLRKSSSAQLRLPAMSWCTTAVEGQPLSLFGTPLGAPQAALILERVIAMGARTIVVLGCCGSLQPGITVGQLVVPTGALSEEGTSVHYPLPAGHVPGADTEITRLFLEAAQQHGLTATPGRVWTTDALFRETRGKIRRYAESGLLAVEMEISALFTVAAFRGVRVGGCLVVSDELGSLKWRPGFANPAFHDASRKAARLAIEVCRRL